VRRAGGHGAVLFIAFYGLWDTATLEGALLTQYVLKSGWEIVMTPVTYRVVGFLKRAEQEDYYDRDTNFTPFSLMDRPRSLTGWRYRHPYLHAVSHLWRSRSVGGYAQIPAGPGGWRRGKSGIVVRRRWLGAVPVPRASAGARLRQQGDARVERLQADGARRR
jgi:hypothetical protein